MVTTDLLHALLATGVLMLPMLFAWWMVGRVSGRGRKRAGHPPRSYPSAHDADAAAPSRPADHARHHPPRP